MHAFFRLIIIIHFSFLFINTGSSQVFPNATPDNIGSVVDQIFQLHGSQITYNYNSVYDFIDNQLPDNITDPDYDPTCSPPEGTVTGFTNNALNIAWDPIINAAMYNVSFLKLNPPLPSSSDMGTISTTNTNAQLPVSEGLLLMSFQTECTLGIKGRLYIVIVEVPIMFPPTNLNCDCQNILAENEAAFWGLSDTDFDKVTFDFLHEEDEIGYYNASISYYGFEEVTEFAIAIHKEGYMTTVELGCEDNTYHALGGSILYSTITEGEWLGAIQFNDGISFDPTIGNSGTFTLRHCSPSVVPKWRLSTSTESTEILIQPNPASTYINIIIDQNIAHQEAEYYVFDALGKRYNLSGKVESIDHKTFQLDIDFLPSGIFNLIIKTKDNSLNTSFIKLN